MTAIVLLFLIGVALLATDAFVSSYVLAAIGAVAMTAGCVLAYQDFGVGGAAVGAGAAIVLLATAVYIELVVLPRSR